MQFYNFRILNDADMSSDLVSKELFLNQSAGYSITASWSGTPTGTLFLECSNGNDVWDTIENSPQTVTAEAGTFTWNLRGTFYMFARLSWSGSGSGSLSAFATRKGV